MTLQERFYDKVYRGYGSCYRWTGALTSLGYGSFGWNGSARQAHRVAWLLEYGPIPKGLCVLHKCDVRDCVNPAHLFLGTQADNVQDMLRKGRERIALPGSNNPAALLNESQVLEIRRRYVPKYGNAIALAREFGVSRATISSIVHRRTWGHLKEATCSA